MGYNTKNYRTDGGDTIVIGGMVTFTGDAFMELPSAPTTISGGTWKVAYQADSTASNASDLKADFNSLLGKLRTAGIMESS